MSLLKHVFMLYLWLFVSQIQAAPALPGFFEVRYDLFYKGIRAGEINRSFSQDGDGTYIFHSEFKTAGLVSLLRKEHIVEQSRWIMNDSEYQPVKYTYSLSGGEKQRFVAIDFDHGRKEIINRIGDSVRHTPFEDGVLDKLLYQLVIMGDLNRGIVPSSYTVVDKGRIKTYLFEYQGKETVNTPAGQFEAVKMKRHRANGKRNTFFWCATELEHLPVAITHIEKDGSAIVAKLRSFKRL